MNRRTLLATIAGGVTILSGCLQTSSEPASTPPSATPNIENATLRPTTVKSTSSTPFSTGTPGYNTPDIVISNYTDTILTVTATVTHIPDPPADMSSAEATDIKNRNYQSSDVIISETFKLPPSSTPELESKEHQNPFKIDNSYLIEISVRDGPTNRYIIGISRTFAFLLINIKKNYIDIAPVVA